jgi:hypothetical protein
MWTGNADSSRGNVLFLLPSPPGAEPGAMWLWWVFYQEQDCGIATDAKKGSVIAKDLQPLDGGWVSLSCHEVDNQTSHSTYKERNNHTPHDLRSQFEHAFIPFLPFSNREYI